MLNIRTNISFLPAKIANRISSIGALRHSSVCFDSKHCSLVRDDISISFLSLSLSEICQLNFAASTPVVRQDPRRTGRCPTERYRLSRIEHYAPGRIPLMAGRTMIHTHAVPSFPPCSSRVFDACHGFCREIALFRPSLYQIASTIKPAPHPHPTTSFDPLRYWNERETIYDSSNSYSYQNWQN